MANVTLIDKPLAASAFPITINQDESVNVTISLFTVSEVEGKQVLSPVGQSPHWLRPEEGSAMLAEKAQAGETVAQALERVALATLRAKNAIAF